MIAASARQTSPPCAATLPSLLSRGLQPPFGISHQPMLVGSVTTMLLASSEAPRGQANCLRRLGDPNSVGTGSATGGATIDMKDGA